MFYFNGDRWMPFAKKVSYTEAVTEFDNDTARFQGKQNLVITDNVLTATETARLEAVSHLNMTLKDVIEYVKNGVAQGQAVEVDKADQIRKTLLSSINYSVIDPKVLVESDIARNWEKTDYFAVGDLIRRNGTDLYKVTIAHKKQADWQPEKTANLFAPLLVNPTPGVIQPWVQPNSTNAYKLNDQVTHNGKTWISMNKVNVWEPGAPGVYDNIWKAI